MLLVVYIHLCKLEVERLLKMAVRTETKIIRSDVNENRSVELVRYDNIYSGGVVDFVITWYDVTVVDEKRDWLNSFAYDDLDAANRCFDKWI